MTAINSVALSNTFDYQRLRLNEVITFVNTEAANNAALTSTYVTNTAFQSALANTNTAIADRLQVANAVATYSTKTQLANTNLAISDRLQVANAVATYSTKAQLANTNLAIADRYQVANVDANFVSKTSTSQQNIQPSLSVANNVSISGYGKSAAAQITTIANTTYTLLLGDAGKFLNTTNASATTITVPNTSVSFSNGTIVMVEQLGAGTVTIAGANTVTINNRRSHTGTAGQYAVIGIKKQNDTNWTLFGDTA